MYELMLLNLILESGSMSVISDYRLTGEYFLSLSDEYNFIVNHYERYGQVPDKATIIANFNNFNFIEVRENIEYIVYKIKEAYTYSKASEILTRSVESVKQDSIQGIAILREQIDVLLGEVTTDIGVSYDIVKSGEDRAEKYKERINIGGLMGVPTGMDELDSLLHGWLPEDLVVLFARTNEGKSWLLLYFLVVAWSLGNRVLMYSGEMSRDVVGYRFDTLYKNFSNRALMQGETDLGGEYGAEDYFEYVEKLKEKDGFIVITPRDLGRKPTVKDIEELYNKYGADIIGIDQLTLMEDSRKGFNKRERYTNITEDLMVLTEKIQKPIIALTQARRETGKNKEEKELPPELDEIYESDGIAQNATRVISMKVVGRILKLCIKKNRYGEKDKDCYMLWDKDIGVIKPLVQRTEGADDYGF